MGAGRPRKAASAKVQHLSKSDKEKERKAEENTGQRARDLLDPDNPPALLKLKDAKTEWCIVTTYFRDMNFYGNIDVASVIGYCNAVAMYKRAWRDYEGEKDVIETEKGPVVNPKIHVIERWSKEMTTCMNRAGFSPSSRISIGLKMVEEEEKDIENRFGAI